MTDERGGYDLNIVKDRNDNSIATYLWTPSSGATEAKGVIYLLHGIMYHSTFEWLEANEENEHVNLKSSIIEKLLSLNLIVIAHDHLGHGRSSGMRVYVDKFDDLIESFYDVITHYKQRFPAPHESSTSVLGFSLGATTCIRFASVYHNIIRNFVLVGPPLSKPSYMKSTLGSYVLNPIANFLSDKLPTLQILWLPKNPDPVIRDAVDKDPLIARVAVRSRVAIEMLNLYDIIDQDVQHIQLPSVVFLYGQNDITVSPNGIQNFMDRCSSSDKTILSFPDVAHDILKENPQATHKACIDWISQRIPC